MTVTRETFVNGLGPLAVSGLAVFLLLLFGGFNCELRNFLHRAPLLMHMLGFVLLYMAVTHKADQRWSQADVFGLSVALHALLYLISRADYRAQLVAVGLLVATVALQQVRVARVVARTPEEATARRALLRRVVTAQWVLVLITACVALVGVMALAGRMKIVRGQQFSWIDFISYGQCPAAKGLTVSFAESLQAFWTSTYRNRKTGLMSPSAGALMSADRALDVSSDINQAFAQPPTSTTPRTRPVSPDAPDVF
jgi:hypothetical protein